MSRFCCSEKPQLPTLDQRRVCLSHERDTIGDLCTGGLIFLLALLFAIDHIEQRKSRLDQHHLKARVADFSTFFVTGQSTFVCKQSV